ncbi:MULTISPECIES: hypothetical protein [unclassified Moorena]|uniref:hypothetical protein n=1 Tax=unclassified Moorena TaxID=2683338 RepID=UPI0013BB06DA|nr:MULTISPECIES: hypothetical protein [unclassified Moorena]NEP64653.1 hypothetical protein [Moorena sp. SIO3A5]NEQ08397.1 hypothetical protein [Moorena sp. SIO4E2]NER85875.1 hypothetical protein [Moorena sp. SIO3A2]
MTSQPRIKAHCKRIGPRFSPPNTASITSPSQWLVFLYSSSQLSLYSRFPIPDSRFPTPDSRFPIPESLTTLLQIFSKSVIM